MWIFVKITDEDFKNIERDKRLIGEIKKYGESDDYVLKSFNSSSKRRRKSKLLCQLPNGSVVESEQLYRMRLSFNKLLDFDSIEGAMDLNVGKALVTLKMLK